MELGLVFGRRSQEHIRDSVSSLFGLKAVAGRSYELGSVLPFVHPPFHLSVPLSGGFLGISPLLFSETLYGARGPYGDVRDRV